MVPSNVEELEELLSRPTPRVIETFAKLPGDLVLLGVGGKMGPTLARMARRASDEVGSRRRVIGVSRFHSQDLRKSLEKSGIETIACNLLDERSWSELPDASNVICMTGFKFGASQTPEYTWAMNCYLPALVCRRYGQSRIAAFSTGNVYGLVPVASGGSTEEDELDPVGEYAMTALGRERMFQYFSREQQTPVILLRLNYATELRYGVLVDIAQMVRAQQPIDLRMGHVNVIWLADANRMALCSLPLAATPARIINVAGLEILSVRSVARRFAEKFGMDVQFINSENERALLNNGRRGAELVQVDQVPSSQMIDWTAEWLKREGPLLNKPTHFEIVDGRF